MKKRIDGFRQLYIMHASFRETAKQQLLLREKRSK